MRVTMRMDGWRRLALAAAMAMFVGAGCITSPAVQFDPPPDALLPRDPARQAAGGSPSDESCGTPEGRLYQPLALVAGQAAVQGRIERPNQVDIYPLTNLTANTAVRIEVVATSGDLDPEVALFDSNGNLLGGNDDRDYDNNILDSLVQFDALPVGGSFYVVVEASRFFEPSTCATTGGYRMTVQVSSGDATAPPEQVVFLDFDGGQTGNIPGADPQTLRPFDAQDLGFPSNQTEPIKDEIVRIMREDYAGYNVRFVSSDDPTPQPPFTTVLFGGGQEGLFGISDEIDVFNRRLDNRVVVFTNNFQDLSREPMEVAQAVANVASHELGHALGLVHIEDHRDLMDRVTPTSFLLQDQDFGRAILSEFLVGYQDEPLLLGWWLGLD